MQRPSSSLNCLRHNAFSKWVTTTYIIVLLVHKFIHKNAWILLNYLLIPPLLWKPSKKFEISWLGIFSTLTLQLSVDFLHIFFSKSNASRSHTYSKNKALISLSYEQKNNIWCKKIHFYIHSVINHHWSVILYIHVRRW